MATLAKVDVVSEVLCISKNKAYQVMRMINKELEEKGYITIQGRVPLDYLKERFNLCDEDVN